MDNLEKAAAVIGWEALACLFHGMAAEVWPGWFEMTLSQVLEQNKELRAEDLAREVGAVCVLAADNRYWFPVAGRGQPVTRNFEWWRMAEEIINAERARDKFGLEAHFIAKHLNKLSVKPVRKGRFAKDQAIKTIQNALAAWRKRAKDMQGRYGEPVEDELAGADEIPENCEHWDNPRMCE